MKKMIFIFLICTQISVAQKNPDRLFTPEELKSDADFYFKMLYANHPNPYYYYSLEIFENKKNEIYAQLHHPLTKKQFTSIIGEINAYVDYHSIIPDLYHSLYPDMKDDFDQSEIFPTVKIRGGKLFLADDLKNDITEINGIKIHDILSDYKKYFNWKLPEKPNYSFLESWLPLLFHYKYKFTAPYRVRFNTSSKIKTLDKISLDEFRRSNVLWSDHRGTTKNSFNNPETYTYEILPASSIAIFYIETFYNQYKDKFYSSLKQFTEEVNNQNIKYIFYDLSKNSGGQFGGYEALDIIKHDTVYFRRTEIARRDGFNEKSDVNEIALLPNHGTNIPSDRKLFVIQSSSTRSAGDYFCRIIKENHLGILVGEDTGEPTVAFSKSYSYEMPNSKIEFTIATTLVDFSSYFNSETLQPDIYWDIHHNREFTEQELLNVINAYKNNKTCIN